jgi:hypothetical protein
MKTLICPDCLEYMTVVDLLDYYCKKAKLCVSIEEHVCLRCANAALKVADVYEAEHGSSLGRTETIEMTCFSDKENRKMNDVFLFSLIKEHYLKMVRQVCQDIFDANWIPWYEVKLWEAVTYGHNTSGKIINKKTLEEIRMLASHTDCWIVNPSSWGTMVDATSCYVTLNEWRWLYNKIKHQAPLLHELHTDHPGTTEKNP